MADTTNNAVIRVKDSQGNLNSIYPVTKKENIIGLVEATASTGGLMTDAQAQKLNGIAAQANKYSHPTYTAKSNGFYKVTVDGTGHVSDTTNVTLDDITALGIPDTTEATTTASGLMSKEDKAKLDGIAAQANKYSHPNNHTATTSQGMYKISVNTSGHVTAVTAVAKEDITALGIPAQDTTYGNATTAAAGLMTSAMVVKLNSIADSANKYSLPTASANTLGGVKVGTNLSISNGVLSATDTTYTNATTDGAGLMSAADKAKLDGIAEQANKYELTSAGVTAALGYTPLKASDISNKAPLASPALTGTPTAPTATANTSSTQIATTEYVINEIKSKLSSNDAMIFKGTIGTGGTVTALPNTHEAGWTYKVITAGTYANVKCEIGDMIICITDGTAANNAHWTVVQTNIDGAVTGPASATSGNIALFDGTTGKIIKDSGVKPYTHPSHTSATEGLYKVTVNALGHVTSTTAVTSTDIENLGVKITDTTYTSATTAKDGLMTSAMVTKLNGIASGATSVTSATVGNWGYTKVTSSTVMGWGYIDADYLAGELETLEDKITDNLSEVATTSANGLMSSGDKTKLDGIASGANNYTHPSNTAWTATEGMYKITVNNNGHVTAHTAITSSDIAGLGVKITDTTYGAATQSANGLMSAADKTKLDGINAGAGKVFVQETQPTMSNGDTWYQVVANAAAVTA